MLLFYTALDETRKTQIGHDNFKKKDITGGPSVEFYIDKLSDATIIVICYILVLCNKYCDLLHIW